MITFWSTEANRRGIDVFLAGGDRSVADRFDVRTYEGLAPRDRVPGGTHVFAAIDQLTPGQRAVASAVCDQLKSADPSVLVCNDPRRVRLRFALLSKLADEGINTFRVFRASDVRRIARFPVFVRNASDHSGDRTGLLTSAAQLRRALVSLVARGHRWRDLMIVEFCDTSDAAGVFRKYAAFRVGDRILPSQVMAARDWRVKSAVTEHTLDLQRENLAYIETNPHEAWLRAVFSLAGIEFGRIDYGVLPDGRPQAWEINLNPTMGRPPEYKRRSLSPDVEQLRVTARRRARDELRSAFLAIDRPTTPDRIGIALDDATLGRAARELAWRRRREALASGVLRLHDRPALGAPLRWISSALPQRQPRASRGQG